MYDIGIIGYGPATLSLLLVLSCMEKPLKIIIFDPFFDGGNLSRNYGNVRSNTTWSQFIEVIEKYCSPLLLQNLRSRFNPEDITSLKDLMRSFLKVVKSSILSSNLQLCLVNHLVEKIVEKEGFWEFDNLQNYRAKVLILNYGAEPRQLGYAKPTLKLDAVINGNDLPCLPGERVLLFGTAHSGTLCIERLKQLGANLTVVHRGSKGVPFKFARDGEYDGIKQDSALIADRLKDEITFISSSEEDKVRQELLMTDWILYACGFDRSSKGPKIFNVSNIELDLNIYDANTGIISGANKMSIFGYGIAYPNSNLVNGKTYYDVSIPSFIKHIEKNVELILKSV